MTEAELYASLEQATATAASFSDSSVVVLTGYLLISFFLGDKLSRFQTIFATLMFVGLYISYQISIWGQLNRMGHFNYELARLGSEIPTDKIYPHFSPVISMLLAVGALYFMWSVRRTNSHQT